mmetsp:Transcript_3203/g.19825  ORF Transcript_3203/g.19825 Transcript_3203/m.19825 type:complete len:107 (-) Transcript_3203:2296-2616(-)
MVSQNNKESQFLEELLYHGHWPRWGYCQCSLGSVLWTSSIEESLKCTEEPLQRFCNIEMFALVGCYVAELLSPAANLSTRSHGWSKEYSPFKKTAGSKRTTQRYSK